MSRYDFIQRREEVRKRLMDLQTPVPGMIVVFKLIDDLKEEIDHAESEAQMWEDML